MTAEQIAQVAHEANRGLQAANPSPGIPVAVSWADLDEHTRSSCIDGVRNALGGATPEESHQNWCDFKTADGWVYGEVKDAEAKTHPCLVDYSDLSAADRAKDGLFTAVVTSLAAA